MYEIKWASNQLALSDKQTKVCNDHLISYHIEELLSEEAWVQ